MVGFFDLDAQLSNIGLKAVGITDNQTIDGGLLGWLVDNELLGSSALTNPYVEGILPDLYTLFYAVATFVLVAGTLVYMFDPLRMLSAYGFYILAELLRRVLFGSIAVICATWILGWLVDLSDGLSLMFGLNADVMLFVVDMFTSAYSCVFVFLGVIGVYATAAMYFARSIILGCLEVGFVIAVTFWMIGAIEFSICKNIEGLGLLLIRILLWGVFFAPMMALSYGVGMGVMMSETGPEAVRMFFGIMILLCSLFVPAIVFLKFVYNPISPVAKLGYTVGRFL